MLEAFAKRFKLKWSQVEYWAVGICGIHTDVNAFYLSRRVLLSL
jgi:hypothetical protein